MQLWILVIKLKCITQWRVAIRVWQPRGRKNFGIVGQPFNFFQFSRKNARIRTDEIKIVYNTESGPHVFHVILYWPLGSGDILLLLCILCYIVSTNVIGDNYCHIYDNTIKHFVWTVKFTCKNSENSITHPMYVIQIIDTPSKRTISHRIE